MRARFSAPFAYTVGAYGSAPGARSISGFDTCRKLQGFPAARARASSLDRTSYGGAATSAARALGGRRAANGRTSDKCGILRRARARDSTAANPRRIRGMLIKFDSNVGGITMFGDIAVALLKAMGNRGTVPGALLAKDIPPALARLKAAVAAAPGEEGDAGGEKPKVSLRQRAFPLIDLLERAAKAGADVLWDKA